MQKNRWLESSPANILSSVQRAAFGLEKEGMTKPFNSARVEDAWTALHVIQDKAKEVRQEFLNDKYH